MRIVTFVRREAPLPRSPADWRLGLLEPSGSQIVDVVSALSWWRPTSSLGQPRDPLAWYDADGPWLAALARLHETLVVDDAFAHQLQGQGLLNPAASCRIGSPVPRPGKIVCVGLNYRDHALEANMAVPSSPVLFAKFTSSVVGHESPVEIPRSSDRIDYEAELAVVIGRRSKGLTSDSALGAVLGYMNANDVSARDFQKQDGQWVRAKSCDTFAPLGPWLVTRDDVPNPNALTIELRVNGETLQTSCTSEFVFDVPTLLAFISDTITLEPGDVVLTGTPAGVGFARRPPIYLRDGDMVEVEVEKLGTLRNPVTASRS